MGGGKRFRSKIRTFHNDTLIKPQGDVVSVYVMYEDKDVIALKESMNENVNLLSVELLSNDKEYL